MPGAYFSMATGRPTKPLNVTPEEREKLSMLARRPKSAQAMAMRARIVLGCDEGMSNGSVARKLHITGATVCKWRERFRVNRLEGLLDGALTLVRMPGGELIAIGRSVEDFDGQRTEVVQAAEADFAGFEHFLNSGHERQSDAMAELDVIEAKIDNLLQHVLAGGMSP